MLEYIVGNDGITLCREAPRAVNDGEIAVASNEELRACMAWITTGSRCCRATTGCGAPGARTLSPRAREISAAVDVSGPLLRYSPQAPRRCFRLLDRRRLARDRPLDARSAPSSVSTDGRAKRRSQVASRRRLQCCSQTNV